MTEKNKKLEERINKTRAAARDRVVKDGTIQFRLDAENMEKLLSVADDRRTGAGVLARMWVLERLKHELDSINQSPSMALDATEAQARPTEEKLSASSSPLNRADRTRMTVAEPGSFYGTPDTLLATAACEVIKMFQAERDQRNRILEASAQQTKEISELRSMLAQQNQALESIKLAIATKGITT